MSMRAAVIRPVPPAGGSQSKPAPIPMDAWRQGDRFVIALDVPGVQPDEVELEARGRLLTVRATRRPAPRTEGARSQYAERVHGVFARRIELADTLDADRLEADLKDGVLTLTVPIAAAAQPRKITIQDRDTRPRTSEADRPAATVAA